MTQDEFVHALNGLRDAATDEGGLTSAEVANLTFGWAARAMREGGATCPALLDAVRELWTLGLPGEA